jgi:hypothetical protein
LKQETKAKKKPEKSDRIKAVAVYSPKIKQGRTASMREVVSFISGRTGLNKGPILLTLSELQDTILFFAQSGRAVKLEGFGTCTPRIGLDGQISLSILPDKEFKNRLNAPQWFGGEIKNKDMIGKTTEDLVDRWNEEHPDDPVK